ncbi:MAG TPA: hypothetical protein VJG32_20305 [Anaerolineae bacterium]|nr:hypothetical protein [Anaerolineae bacterium]
MSTQPAEHQFYSYTFETEDEAKRFVRLAYKAGYVLERAGNKITCTSNTYAVVSQQPDMPQAVQSDDPVFNAEAAVRS